MVIIRRERGLGREVERARGGVLVARVEMYERH